MLLSPHDFEAQPAWGFGGHHHSPLHRGRGLTTLCSMSHGCPIQKNSSKAHLGAGYFAKGLKQSFKTNQEPESLQINELHGSCPGKGSGVAIKILAQLSMVAAGLQAQEQACSLTAQKGEKSRQMGSCSQRERQQEHKSSSEGESKCCGPQQGSAAWMEDSPSLGVRGGSHTTSRSAGVLLVYASPESAPSCPHFNNAGTHNL